MVFVVCGAALLDKNRKNGERRPVELIEQAMTSQAPAQRSILLAEAGLREGLPDFVRRALDGVENDESTVLLRARAAWLGEDYEQIIRLADKLERDGTSNHRAAFLAAQAAWRMRDYRRASRWGRQAETLAQADPVLSETETRPYRWAAAYFDTMAGRKPAHGGNWLVNRAILKRWQRAPQNVGPIIGLFDYKAPDFSTTSANLGDFIQSAAILRHLARFRGINWSVDQPMLYRLFHKFRESWNDRPALPKNNGAHLAVFDRDAPQSIATRFPGQTVWAVYNGWFCHKPFGKSDAFPPPDNLMPILLGFHLWRPSDLTPQTIDWLREYGPVGCRDRTTLRWMLNQGIDAFFSGCPTMTLDLADRAQVRRSGRYRVDLKQDNLDPEDWIETTHHDWNLRKMLFAQAMEAAVDRLEDYASAKEVHTSRLHCLLPCQALDTVVRFDPGNEADRRFEGLVGLDRGQRKDLSDEMTALLQTMFELILTGVRPEAVRKRWREMTLPAVEAEKRKLFGSGAPPPRDLVRPASRPSARIRDPNRQRATDSPNADDTVTIAMAFDAKYAERALVTLHSVCAHGERPLELVLLVRGLSEEELKPFANLTGVQTVRVFHMDGRLEGLDIELLQKITISTMDRLFLGELLPDRDRVIYLDCDTIVLDDIGRLAEHDPGTAGLAARPTPNPKIASIAEMSERRAAHMCVDKARGLRTRLAAEIDLCQRGFNAGVLVLSLDRLRANGLLDRAISYATEFGLHDQDALNFACSSGYAALPDRWNSMPQYDLDPNPALIHWVGARKPWMKTRVRCQDKWHFYSDPLKARTSKGPAAQAITKDHWLDPAAYRSDWDGRAKMAARWIAPGSRVLDLGCGARLSLRQHLPVDCTYQGVDQKDWNGEVLAMDLDSDRFPDGEYDVATMLGLIEYLQCPDKVLSRAAQISSNLIITYCHPCDGSDPAKRSERGWINAFGPVEFLALLEQGGWQVEEMKTYLANANIRQLLYRCARK